ALCDAGHHVGDSNPRLAGQSRLWCPVMCLGAVWCNMFIARNRSSWLAAADCPLFLFLGDVFPVGVYDGAGWLATFARAFFFFRRWFVLRLGKSSRRLGGGDAEACAK